MKKKLFTLMIAGAALAATNPLMAEGNADAGQAKASKCSSCHMPDGNSVAPAFPKIAGQADRYIVKQINDMKNGARPNQTMAPFVVDLSEQDIMDLAAYYSKQTATSGSSTSAAGEKVYHRGAYRRGMTACVGCHGMKGEGNQAVEKALSGPVNPLAPALAGQHSTYLETQLKAFRDGTRTNDANSVMRDIAKNMTDEEIAAVSSYIAGM